MQVFKTETKMMHITNTSKEPKIKNRAEKKNKKHYYLFACFLSQIRPVHWAGISVANF